MTLDLYADTKVTRFESTNDVLGGLTTYDKGVMYGLVTILLRRTFNKLVSATL